MSDFLNKTPALRLVIFLAIGVIVGEFLSFSSSLTVGLFAGGCLFLLLPFIIQKTATNYRFRWLFGVGTLLILISLGIFLNQRFTQKTDLNYTGQSGIYEIVLDAQPVTKERSVMFRANIRTFTDSVATHTAKGKVILYFAKDSSTLKLERGDILLISSHITQPKLTGNPEEFDYGNYLKHQGIGGTGYVASGAWQKIGEEHTFSLLTTADQCRNYLLKIYRKLGLSGDEFGMLAALTLGYKDALTPELRESFSTTGAMHVLAVSGLHVGIIYVVIGWLLGFLDKRKKTQSLKPILIILFLWIYAFITGLSPSVMRASLMFSFMALAGVIGKKSQTYNTIFASAFVLLLYQPTLLFDVGFQLSYSAVLAIVYFQPKIVGIFYIKNRFLRWAWELTAVSVAAQIGTAPFSLFYFHQFPNYFLLSNFVVIPAATIILYFAITLFAVSWIPYVNMAVAFLLNWVLRLLYMAIAGIEQLPHALSIIWISYGEVLLFYLIIGALIVVMHKFSFRTFSTLLVLILMALGVRTVNTYQNLTKHEVIVWNHSKELIVNRISTTDNLVIASDTLIAEKLAHDYWENCGAAKPKMEVNNSLANNAFVCGDKTFLVLDENPFKYKKVTEPLKVGYLIISIHIYPSERLFTFIDPKNIITCGNVYPATNKQFAKLATEKTSNFYAVREQGAWQMKGND